MIDVVAQFFQVSERILEMGKNCWLVVSRFMLCLFFFFSEALYSLEFACVASKQQTALFAFA